MRLKPRSPGALGAGLYLTKLILDVTELCLWVSQHRKPSANVSIAGVIINLYLYSFVNVNLYLRLEALKDSPRGTEGGGLRDASWMPRQLCTE